MRGVYIHGKVEDQEVIFTVDTGACATILSKRVIDRMSEDTRPQIAGSKRKSFSGPAGGPFEVFGVVEVTMSLGEISFRKKLPVADLLDDCLLGADILLGLEEGPFDLLLTENRLVWNGVTIPVLQIGSQSCGRVTCAETFVVPGNCEVVLPVNAQSNGQVKLRQEVMIEPDESFLQNHQLLVASALVDLQNGEMMRVMNPHSTDVTLHKGEVIGRMGYFDSVVHVLDSEQSSTINCNEAKGDSSGKISRINQNDNKIPEHLIELYDRTIANKDVSDELKLQVANLLIEFQDVFSKDENDLGHTNLAEHRIETGDARPIKQAPRRVPLAFQGRDKEALDKMLARGTIRKSTSPWASPIVLVAKKDGSVRVCVDYRKVNEVTKKDAFPLPRVSDCLDTVAGAGYFSTLDLTAGYNQVPVAAEDIPKTAFVTKHGLFESPFLPFGLSNGPATFQRVMELALQGLQWNSCLIYLDDVIIFGSTVEQHFNRLRQVLTRLRQANLKLKPDKCHILQDEVLFLGHTVSKHGVQPSPINVEKILAWAVPTSTKEVRQFLGMATYYRRFIQNFAKIAAPLSELTSKNVEFHWGEESQQAFDRLKSALVGPEVMAYPLNDGEFILDTDACDNAIGAVLSQIQNGSEKVVAYASRTMSKCERNYCVTDKELLAVKHFIEYFRHYLLGKHFVVRSDHQALKWLFSLREPKGRVARWLEILAGYDFEIEYRPGKRHGNADAMSRCPNPHDCHCMVSDDSLKCGPCQKCLKKSEEMYSMWLDKHNKINRAVQMRQSMFSVFCLWVMSILVIVVGTVNKLWDAIENCIPMMQSKSDTLDALQDDGRLWPKLKSTYRKVKGYIYSFSKLSQLKIRQVQIENQLLQGFTKKQLQENQQNDPNLSHIYKWVKDGKRPVSGEVCCMSPEVRHYWNYWNTLEYVDGLLFKKFNKHDGTGVYYQFLVPKQMRDQVLFQMHNSILSGHLGRKKTKQKLLQRFYWFQVGEDVKLWVTKCDICQQMKSSTKKPRAPLGNMTSGAPLDRLCIDVLGPFPLTPRKNRYILVITDSFSKWVEIHPIPDETASTCARILLNEVICRYGCPLDLHSDQGRNFQSNIFKELCEMLEIRKTRSSPRNPKSNGQPERFNRSLLPMIRSYLKGQQKEWDLHLGCLAGAYRMTPHESTTLTPNMLMLGREVRMPYEVILNNTTSQREPITSYGEYVSQLRSKLNKSHEVARKHLQNTAVKQKKRYDAKCVVNKYQQGDLVWLLNEIREVDVCSKLQPAYIGPFVISKVLSVFDCEVVINAAGKTKVIHHDKLKPYKGDNPPNWVRVQSKKLSKQGSKVTTIQQNVN